MKKLGDWILGGVILGLFVAVAALLVIGLITPAEAQTGTASSQSIDLGVNPSAKYAATTTETLVLNATATAMPASVQKPRKSVEIQNLGPNAIFCCIGTVASPCTPTVNKSRQVAASGGSWTVDASSNLIVKCKAATADQATGAATIVTEVY